MGYKIAAAAVGALFGALLVAMGACSSGSVNQETTPDTGAGTHPDTSTGTPDGGSPDATSSKDAAHDAPTKDAPPRPKLKPSGPLTLSGDAGVVMGLHITSTTGDCVTLNDASGVVLKGNDIGPCAGNAVVVAGGDTITIQDNYIHPEHPPTSCCDTGDGVFAHDTKTLAILGNVIAYGEANIEVGSSDGVRVIGNFLLNPQNGGSRGQNFQAWNGSFNIDVENNYALSSADKIYTFPPKQEDSINFGVTTGIVAKNNYVQGGSSPSGCGIIADDQADSVQFLDNQLFDTGQCGIGIANGTKQVITGNKILNDTPVDGGGNTGLYVWNQYDAACGPVLVTNNVVSAIKPDGTQSSYWYGGGCDPVTTTGNTFDNDAAALLMPPSKKLPPPPIPPVPVTCVAPSPYVNNTSFPSCGTL